jgi:hypothetical protein
MIDPADYEVAEAICDGRTGDQTTTDGEESGVIRRGGFEFEHSGLRNVTLESSDRRILENDDRSV